MIVSLIVYKINLIDNEMDERSELELNFIAFIVFAHEFPVNDVIKVLEVGSTGVSVVNVISMFPDINSQ